MTEIKKIILTEKSQQLEKRNVFSFLVNPKLNKNQIKTELLKIFPKIQIKKIRTCRYQPIRQKTRFSRKLPGKNKTSLKKKAFVQLTSSLKKQLLE